MSTSDEMKLVVTNPLTYEHSSRPHRSHVWLVVPSTSDFLFLSLLTFVLQTPEPHNNVSHQRVSSTCLAPAMFDIHPMTFISFSFVPSTYLHPSFRQLNPITNNVSHQRA
ncbi:uncharacterized protein N7479_004768 [Penicillium vulpinum]|uniref:uncharacterized protein n=1 Tax=Penicillium vulpinum TaxID=29845 RepID=UPI002547C4B1|nr:uncharacterized protein N7479_004768 [Penicillium vulpinum]KAJ5964892.1 hypothetical protein N7479_004768 [Penicillium vulpinum]